MSTSSTTSIHSLRLSEVPRRTWWWWWVIQVISMLWMMQGQIVGVKGGAVNNLVLGAVLPLTANELGTAADGTSMQAALNLGVNYVNDNILNAIGYNITVVYKDSQADEKLALFGAFEICNKYTNVIGIVGEVYSDITVDVAEVGELYKVPVMSPSATEDILSDKVEFPYFMRLVQPDSQQASTMARLVSAYGWTRYALISTTDTYGAYGAAALKNAATDFGLTLLAEVTVNVGDTDYSTQIETIANSGAKIILVFALADPAIQILSEAYNQDLIGNGYVWIGTDGMAAMNVATLNATGNINLKDQLINVVATAPYAGANATTLLPNMTSSFYVPFIYDIPLVFANAIQRMAADSVTIGNGTTTLSYLYRTNINGITGNITFDSNGNRIGLYEIVQWSVAGSEPQFVSLGAWPQNSVVPSITFAGGYTPSDDPLSGVVKLGFYVAVSRQSSIYATVKLAVDRINANNTIPGVSVALVTKTQTTSAQAIVDAPDLLADHVVGVIGPSTSDVCKPVAQMLGVLKVPQLSFAATTPYLSDKLEVPYFIRNVAPDSSQVSFFNVIMAQYNWKQVGFLYTVESYGSDGFQYYQNLTTQVGSKVVIISAVSFQTDATTLSSQMQVAASMVGMLAIVPYKGSGPAYEQLLEDITNSNITYENYNASTYDQLETNPYTIYAYDAAWIFAEALRKMVLTHQDYKNGTLLLNELYQTNYSGYSGLTAFDKNGDRLAPYNFLNWRSASDQDYTVVGYWNPVESPNIQMSITDIIWLGGATSTPSDTFKTSKGRSTLAIVLSVVLVALGIGVIILIVLLYISRSHRRHIAELVYAEPWDDSEYPRESYDIKGGTEGLTVNKTRLSFGLPSTYRFPVDVRLVDHLNLHNVNTSYTSTMSFQFFVPQSEGRFACKVSPGSGVLKSGETIQITIEFTLLCTTDVDRLIKLKLTEGSKISFLYFQINFEGEISDILDPDELEIKEPLGTGGFGTVYKGRYRGTEVAIKTMNHQLLASDIAEFNKELGIMRKLKHGNIVPFVGASVIPHKRCLVTEYCKYGSLGKFMADHGKSISFQFKLRVALDIAQAMNFLHQNGVWHRDIKPDNVLIVSRNTDSVVVAKITDFGTSRSVTAMHHDQMYNHTLGLGTPIYMAPEILERQPYNHKIDVYSFGILLWELLTQQTPYYFIEMHWDIYNYVVSGRRNPIPAETNPTFAALITSCWARSPANRPSFQQIITILENIMQSDPQFKRVPSIKEFSSDSSGDDNNSSVTNTSVTNNSVTGNSITIEISPDFDGGESSSKGKNKNNNSNNTSNSDNDSRTGSIPYKPEDSSTLRPRRKTSAPPSVSRKLSDTFAGLLTIGKKNKEKKKRDDSELLRTISDHSSSGSK